MDDPMSDVMRGNGEMTVDKKKVPDPYPSDYVVVSIAFLHGAYDQWVSDNPWELHPEFGEYDMDHILDTMRRMLPTYPSPRAFEAAYRRFTERTKTEEV